MDKLIELFNRTEERNLTLTLTRKAGKWHLALYSTGTLLVQMESSKMEEAIGTLTNYLKGVSFIDVQA